MTLTKADLADNLIMNLNMSGKDAKAFVDNFFETFKDTIVSGEQVRLSGFGTFETRSKTERPGRNPRTGEAHVIEARRVCVFSAGNKLRGRCGQKNKPESTRNDEKE